MRDGCFWGDCMYTPVQREFLVFPCKATEMLSELHFLQPSGHKYLTAFSFHASHWDYIRAPIPTSCTVKCFPAKNSLIKIIFTRGKKR